MAGCCDPERARTAMASLDAHLVKRDARMVLLLTPPFDLTALEPGYIKGYVPGVRENGAQYTHGAVWSVVAFAKLGDGDRAAELYGMLNPITHSSTPVDVERYKVEPIRRPSATCTLQRGTSAAAGGPGTRGQPAGCTARESKTFSAFSCAAPDW